MNEIERPATFIAAGTVNAGVRSPFVGTRPFSADDTVYFFGREREATRLANLIVANTLTVLYGDSGVGKSSLINARLPLALDELEPDWLIIPFLEWQVGCERRLEGEIADKTGNPIRDGLAKTLLTFADKTGRPVLLALDQFEEYFAYHPDGISGLDAELAKLINRRDSPVRVLLSLRSDGLFLLDRLRLRIPNIFGSMMLIEALDDKAAVDCVRLPLKAYNSQPGTASVQIPSQELVNALISGADEELILLRLPGRGRSELEKGDRRRMRIVAPFLQMALEMLWQADVVESQRNSLQLSTLRQLAELDSAEASSEAVGAIAQKYVDSILRGFDDAEKQVCAVIVERMVLPSGQKVAVKLLDLDPVLTESEQCLAVSILERLSSNQSKRLIKMVAGVRDSEPHYQIVHDAMAIPLLGWAEQWKTEERAAQARREAEEKAERERHEAAEKARMERAAALAREDRAKRRAMIFAVLATLAALLIFAGAAGTAYFVNATTVANLTSAAKDDPNSGFRLPLLFSVAALDSAWWPTSKRPTIDVLQSRLLQSPREGGEFSAAGFDAARGVAVWIEGQSLMLCDLRTTETCEVLREGIKASPDKSFASAIALPDNWYDDARHQSRNERLRLNQFISVGFVSKLDGPVIYRRGSIYSRRGQQWIVDDLDDLLPDLHRYTGMVVVDVAGAGLRVSINDWPSGQMWIMQLAPSPEFIADPRQPLRWIATSAPQDRRPVRWRPGTFSPVISPDGTFEASVSQERIEDGGLRILANLNTVNPEASIRTSELEKISGKTTIATVAQFAREGARPGLGFTAGNEFLAVAYRDLKETRHLRLIDASARPAAPERNFQIRQDAPRNPPVGNPFSYPPITAVRLSQLAAAPEIWRFAWLTPRRGVRLLQGVASDPPAELEERQLLSGLDTAVRLEFSVDGQYLVQQSPNFDRRTVTMRIWDLGSGWRRIVVESAKHVPTLRQLACRVAAIEGKHSTEQEKFLMKQYKVETPPC